MANAAGAGLGGAVCFCSWPAGCEGPAWTCLGISLCFGGNAEHFMLHKRIHTDLDTELEGFLCTGEESLCEFETLLNLGTFTPLELGGLK